jgi:hypothetical protein
MAIAIRRRRGLKLWEHRARISHGNQRGLGMSVAVI